MKARSDKTALYFWIPFVLWLSMTIYVIVMLTTGGKNNALWNDSIHNRANGEYVNETAWNLGVDPSEVTQKQFNARYLSK